MNKFLIGLVLINLPLTVIAEVTVTNAWVKPTVPGQPVAGAYMTLLSDHDVNLISASSTVAKSAEIHEMSMTGNIMRMRQIKQLPLHAGKAVELAPGGFHIMLIDLHHQINDGEIIPLKLVTEDKEGNKKTISMNVKAKDVVDAKHNHRK